MKVLVIGGGAREHAICDAIYRSKNAELYSFMKNLNPGIAQLTKQYHLGQETDITKVVQFAKSKKIDMALIGPEAPLEKGLTDALQKQEISVCSPSQKAAQIETNKAWMRKLLHQYKIPGQLKYNVFSSSTDAEPFIEELDGNIAIKPLGLTGGKGVRVAGDHFTGTSEAMEYIQQVITTKIGGSAQVLIEEKAIGEEFTLQAFSDGCSILTLPAVQDHKRLLPDDKGPNTGGMGSYSCADGLLPFLSKKEYDQGAYILSEIITSLRKEGYPYIGPIYGQFMVTKKGIKIIEINARFGDPEAMNVLPLLQTDYVELCQAIINQELSDFHIHMDEQSTVCKYVVPEGYGYQSMINQPIHVNESAITKCGARLFYASVNQKDNMIYTSSSRALAVVGIADELPQAEHIAEEALSYISGDHIFIRHDIGKNHLINQRVKNMNMLRAIT